MSTEADEKFMRRALELARQAEGRTHPNPMVGCVIVDAGGEIVAEGYHRAAGEAHAEVEALRNLDQSVDASSCTLYVNLEPCSHHGRTPPCSDAIVSARLGRVVIATIDPNPRVSGAGITRIRAAGIEVVTGVLEDEARHLNRAFFKYITTGLPLVVAKYAMTLDGKIASRTGSSQWISGEVSRAYVHELRNRLDAILVGTGTLAKDDPSLTCRMPGGRHPLKVLLDPELDYAPDSRAVSLEGDAIVFCSEDADDVRVKDLEALGAKVVRRPVSPEGEFDMAELLAVLAREGEVTSVLVEGGGALLGSLFDDRLIDRIEAFVAPILVGGQDGIGPVLGMGRETMGEADRLSNVEIRTYGDDVLIAGDMIGDE
jgi:diaminohydroxyphosphoribosylaminopyrimidine deaminase/5-amino-6-(5-phosphoribosylamino)uracil reductase